MSKQIKHIHLLGVCGTAMGSLAMLLQQRGSSRRVDENTHVAGEVFASAVAIADAEEIETTINARNLANGDNNLIICVQKNKQKLRQNS